MTASANEVSQTTEDLKVFDRTRFGFSSSRKLRVSTCEKEKFPGSAAGAQE